MTKTVAYVTNEPAPYRIPAWNQMAMAADIRLHIIFCCEREPNRAWDLPEMEFDRTYLRERITTLKDRYVHNNIDVFAALKRVAPDVIITSGFNPTHLYAFAYARLKAAVHVAMTDGTLESERNLTALHRVLRRYVYARSAAFISASEGGKKLFESYGISAGRCFQACLCVDNADYLPAFEPPEPRFDFIFCGRIEAVKNPLFVLEVALRVAKNLGRRISVLYVGSGSLEDEVRAAAARHPELLDVTLSGFAMRQELPALYRAARLFLFPTRWDPWGVVANEACAAGLPVLVSPYAGAAGELILDGENGFICALDPQIWAERATLLLSEPRLYRQFSQRSATLVKRFNFSAASSAMLDACRFAVTQGIAPAARKHI